MRHLGRRGFSLVELLIVIGIIVLLLAILLPALSAAREHAKRVKCMSNLGQLTAAWLMYANDNRGHFCSSEMQDVVPGQIWFTDYTLAGVRSVPNIFWSWIGDGAQHQDIPRGILWPYLKDLQVYYCPNDPSLPDSIYRINGLLAGQVGKPTTLFTLAQVRQAERTFVFIEAGPTVSLGGGIDVDDNRDDADDHGSVNSHIDDSFATSLYPASAFLQLPGAFHQVSGTNGTPISFVDGHVIFWQYANPWEFALGQNLTRALAAATDTADVSQLEAWSGGPIPPGATP
jgi:prepilin-type N-terminal cleavage/methylation domain-containing protein